MKFLVLAPTSVNMINRLIKYFFDYLKNFLITNGNEVIIEKVINKNSNLKHYKKINTDILNNKLKNIYKDIDYVILFQYIGIYQDMREVLKNFKVILINTEQTTTPNRRINYTIDYLEKEHKKFILADYNRENFEYFNKFINEKNYFVLEPNYSFIKNIHKKTIDLAIYNRQSKHDKEYISKYLSNIIDKCINMRGRFNKKRLEFISKCKIFINIHAGNKYKIGETHRLNELVAHRCIVISQNCLKKN